jgi:hypothetical protein
MNDDAERPETIEAAGASDPGTEASAPVETSSAAPPPTEVAPEEPRGGPTPPAMEASPDSKPAARAPAPSPPARRRPALSESQEPLYRQAGGFRLRLEPADLARLRELPGAKGRTDQELGEEFFEKQAERFVQSLAEDVAPPAEVRVVVDPYSRQAFLAIERTIRSIVSF